MLAGEVEDRSAARCAVTFSRVKSMTWSAPSERISSTLRTLHTPVTSAPRVLAICTANGPTPPDAPLISSAWPGSHLVDVAQALQGGDGGDRHRCGLLEGRCMALGASRRSATQASSGKLPVVVSA